MRSIYISALLLLGICAGLSQAASTYSPEVSTQAPDEDCEQDVNCHLPDCLCPSIYPPVDANLPLEKVPQFVILSFDDAVTVSNYPFYESFRTLTNPNGCPISMTFFVSHTYTNYTLVNELHRLGHEIALHSVSHKSDVQNYWRPANKSTWFTEMSDIREIISYNAKIPKEELKGWRAPFLEVGGDEMYSAMNELGLSYDSTWPTLQYTDWYGSNPKGSLWPYTLDYPSIQDCQLGRCPEKTYPGQWIFPMIDLQDNAGEACAMLDTCRSRRTELVDNAEAIEAFLKRNFNMHYLNNKAPFGLYAHHSWFYENEINGTDARHVGYKRFLQYLSTKSDVYVVSLNRVLDWMKNPVSLEQLNTLDSFRCRSIPPETNCPDINNYEFRSSDEPLPNNLTSLIMSSCVKPKPETFPWLNNPFGNVTQTK